MTVLNRLARISGRKYAGLNWRDTCRMLIFSILVIIAGFMLGLKIADPGVFAQTNEKTISLGPHSIARPQIKISKAWVGNEAKEFDKGFTVASDWLQHTSFQIENMSGKPIVYLKINIWFPETTKSGNVMIFPIIYGNRPGAKLQTADSFKFLPNETKLISLNEKYNDIAQFVGVRHSIASLNQIRLQIKFIVWEDGTAWDSGSFMEQDPNNPDHYVPVLKGSPEIPR